MTMKPRKKQRIDFQNGPKGTEGHGDGKGKKRDNSPEDVNDSSDNEHPDEIIEDEDDDGDFEGIISFSPNLTLG